MVSLYCLINKPVFFFLDAEKKKREHEEEKNEQGQDDKFAEVGTADRAVPLTVLT
jgi:hypothetical protein